MADTTEIHPWDYVYNYHPEEVKVCTCGAKAEGGATEGSTWAVIFGTIAFMAVTGYISHKL